MKAISLHQPWASWIARGLKTIETRSFRTRQRGPLLICSTKMPDLGLECYPLGKALCIVNVDDCRPMRKTDEDEAMCTCEPGRWAWVLSDITPIDPFDVKGSQGFFEVAYEH